MRSQFESRSDSVVVGGLLAYVGQEAEKRGLPHISKKVESVFIDLLKTLTPAEQQDLLMLSHEITLRGTVPEPVKLRLVSG
jgi:hypothetical protein